MSELGTVSNSVMKRMLPALALAAVAVITPGQALGDNTQFHNGLGTGDGSWGTAGNWTGGLPSSAVEPKFAFVNVNGSGPATVNTPGQSAQQVYVGQGAGDGSLIITSGGELSVTTEFLVAHDSGRNGTYTQNGGTLSVGTHYYLGNGGGTATATVTGGVLNTTGALRLSDFDGNSSANSSFTINGGTLNTGGLVAIGVRTGGTGTGRGTFDIGGDAIVNIGENVAMRPGAGNSFTVNGSGADINVNRPAGPNVTGFEVHQANDVNFNFDGAGVSAVDIAALMRWSHADSTLNVDATALGTSGTFDLFTFDGYFNNGITRFGTENLTLAPGMTGEIQYTANSIQLVMVPEPASLGLLALGGLFALRRRRA
jgi:hypothetical protein